MALTIYGGKGFVLSEYVKQFYHHAIGTIASVNERNDLSVYSEDVLYGISTVTNHHVFSDVHIDIDTNLTVLMTVVENWKKYQEKTGKKGVFSFLSSWSVLGNQENLPVGEDASCSDCHGMYIITKRCAEQLLIDYCVTFGLQYRIIRLCNIVGPDPKVSKQKNGLQYNLQLLSEDKDVELFGTGEFFRDFMHVEDAARAIECVVSRGGINEIFHIGNGRTWLYRDILEFAKKELNSKGFIVYKEPSAFQAIVPVKSFYFDVKKIRKLGFYPQYTDSVLYRSILPKG